MDGLISIAVAILVFLVLWKVFKIALKVAVFAALGALAIYLLVNYL